MAAFYEAHNSSLLSHCADGRISLRRPVNLASPYVSSQTVDVEGRLRLGVAQLLVDEEQPDVSHLPSYFAYGKYNLLGKFIGSREFIRLEGRYLRYRRSEEHTSELQSLMRISYAVFCLKKKTHRKHRSTSYITLRTN